MNVTKVFSALSGLSSVHRYSMDKLIQPESVLEHTAMVVFLANLLAREVNNLDGETFDVNWITLCALVHDLDELVIGDIPRPTKYRNERTVAIFKELGSWGIDNAVTGMELSVEMGQEIHSAYARAKKGRDGLVVAMADCMCVCEKIWEELLVRGNHAMVGHAVRVLDQLKTLRHSVHQEFGEVGKVTGYLVDIIDQCESKMDRAAMQNDPIYGNSMRT